MKTAALALATAVLLSGCGAGLHPTAARTASALQALAVDRDAVLAKPASGAHKQVVPLPQPDTRQGLTRKDAASVAKDAYAQAYAAKTPAEAFATAKLGLEKVLACAPTNAGLRSVVKFAQATMDKADVSDPECARRLALWPLHYLGKGCAGLKDPLFFEMAAMMMESMLTWQDGLVVGLVLVEQLDDHPDAYVKTMIAKASAKFRSPKVGLEESYKITLATLKEIQDTLETLAAK